MGNWRQWIARPGIALLALSALAAWPVLRAGYPAIGDGLNHFYRLVEFEHLLQHGAWFPRWATDLGYGYGYPLFNYYPPLAYTLGALFGALGLSVANSLLAVYGAGWLMAVSGAYRLARERGGPAAGLIAAAAYGLAPYLYFNTLARGALPETLGLGLLPWLLWACYRLSAQPSRGRLLLSATLLAALILTHLLTALLALPLIALFALMARRAARPASSQATPPDAHPGRSIRSSRIAAGAYASPLLAVALGFGLAAYFILPAVLETRSVQIGQLTQPGSLDYHNNFLALGDLLALPSPFDARLVFRAVPPSLSLAALALAVLGLVRRAWARRRGRHLLDASAPALDAWDAGLWLGLAGLSLLTLRLSLPIWEHTPDASLIQFPWRLVGPASLLLALLAGRADLTQTPVENTTQNSVVGRAVARPTTLFWEKSSLQIAGPALAVTGLFFWSLTWTFSAGPPAPATAIVRDLASYERDSGQLGTTSAGEFLPVGVAHLPDPHSLEGAYALHSVIERLGALPAGVTVESQDASVTAASAVVVAQSPALLTFELFNFPGWRATLDSQPAPIITSQPNGLIQVMVPAGQHSVAVAFGSTPLRGAASALSFIAVGLLAIIASGRVPFGREDLTPKRSSPIGASLGIRGLEDLTPPAPLPLKGRGEKSQGSARDQVLLSIAMALTVLLLLGLRVVAIDGRETVFARSRFDGANVASVRQVFDANFQDQLVLIGMDLPGRQMAADAALPVTLYWRAQNVPAVNYATTLQVLDDQGNLWGQSDSQNPGDLPTSRWQTSQYARDVHLLRLRPGTPPGQYQLVTGVYQVGGAALSVLDANRVPQGSSQLLGSLMVTRGHWELASLAIAQPANLGLGPLTYLGGSLSSASPQAGDDLAIELFWRAEGATRPDLTLHVELADAQGHLIQHWDGPPARTDYPTDAWEAGEIVRSLVRLPVPADAPGGPARLQISLTGAPGVPLTATIASLNVRVPARSFVAPPVAHALGTPIGPAVKLLGYDLRPDGVTLYWQAVQGMSTSYSAFVHALDAAGTIVSQVDAVPLNGTRPTTGWLPGEVLTDPYNLSFSGAASLEVGLYDPATRQRLGTVTIPLR